MYKIRGFNLLAFVFAAMWVLAVSGDSWAQGQGQEKNKSEKDKKKTEQRMDKEKRGNDKADKSHREEDESRAEQIKKIKYKPRRATDEDMTEWTDGNPPGWQRGRKTGWRGAGAPPGQMKDREVALAHPPGWETWDVGRRDDWNSRLDQSRSRIIERVRARKDPSSEDEQSAVISLDGAARKGVPLEHVESIMSKAITRGMRGRDIETMTRAISYGADKDTDYDRLDRSIDKSMNAGVTGDDLALSIYKAIDEQHPPKSQEPVKKPWWKRLFRS